MNQVCDVWSCLRQHGPTDPRLECNLGKGKAGNDEHKGKAARAAKGELGEAKGNAAKGEIGTELPQDLVGNDWRGVAQ